MMKKTHNRKRIIMLIVYILLIGLCTLIAIKGCTSNITYALDASNWEQLNNVPIRCVIEGPVNNADLSNNTWSYISNGNSETGPAQATPAFYITDTTNGEQYDAIYIQTRDIQLRRFIYDEVSGDMVDYYYRTIWQDDWIQEQIDPETIIFENLNNTTMASNAVKYSLAGFGGQEQTGANNNAINGIMLGIINNLFDFAIDNELNIFYGYIDDEQYLDFYILENRNGLFGYKLIYYDELNQDEQTIIINRQASIEYMLNYLNQEITIEIDGDTLTIYYTAHGNEEHLETTSITINSAVDYENFTLLNWVYSLNCIKNYLSNYNQNIGFSEGYRTGREVGYDEGYDDGYDDGASGEINTTWVLSLMNTATSILNIEILPNIRIIYLVGAFIVLAFVRFVIGWLR